MIHRQNLRQKEAWPVLRAARPPLLTPQDSPCVRPQIILKEEKFPYLFHPVTRSPGGRFSENADLLAGGNEEGTGCGARASVST